MISSRFSQTHVPVKARITVKKSNNFYEGRRNYYTSQNVQPECIQRYLAHLAQTFKRIRNSTATMIMEKLLKCRSSL